MSVVDGMLFLNELPGEFTETGWKPPLFSPEYDVWESGLNRLSAAANLREDQLNVLRWALGDWLVYGEGQYGEKFSQALDETHYLQGSLNNMAWIARNMPHERRQPHVSFWTHKEVLGLDDHAQEIVLQHAAADNLYRREVREEADAYRKSGQQVPDTDFNHTPIAAVETATETCPTCHGAGIVKKVEATD